MNVEVLFNKYLMGLSFRQLIKNVYVIITVVNYMTATVYITENLCKLLAACLHYAMYRFLRPVCAVKEKDGQKM